VVRDLLPASGARILMTTQWSDWAGRAAEVKLDTLRQDVAAQFLQLRTERSDPAGDSLLPEYSSAFRSISLDTKAAMPLAMADSSAYAIFSGIMLRRCDCPRFASETSCVWGEQ
jgi:hypothetical protein